MNKLIKGAVCATAVLASGSAFAMGAVNSGSSDLVLWVQALNPSTSAVVGTYAFDTGLTISSIFGPAPAATGANLAPLPGVNQTFSTIGAGATTLSSFLTSNSGDTILWGLEGGFYTGTLAGGATTANSKISGAAESIFTSTLAGASSPNSVSTLTGNAFISYLNGLAGASATPPGGAGAVESLVTLTANASGTTTAASWTGGDQAKFGILGNGASSDAIVGVGPGTVTLYGITGNSPASLAGSATLQSFVFGTASLSSTGVLTLAGNNQGSAPLPAALWLLGSGLLGLCGVRRRSV
jgi:hypothetical protein